MVHLANHMFHLTHILCFELQELLPCNAAIEQRVVLPSYHGGGKYEVYICTEGIWHSLETFQFLLLSLCEVAWWGPFRTAH